MFVAYLLLGLKLGLLKTSIIIHIKISCCLYAWLHWSCDNGTVSRNIFGITFVGFEGILNHLRLNSCVILFDKKYTPC